MWKINIYIWTAKWSIWKSEAVSDVEGNLVEYTLTERYESHWYVQNPFSQI